MFLHVRDLGNVLFSRPPAIPQASASELSRNYTRLLLEDNSTPQPLRFSPPCHSRNLAVTTVASRYFVAVVYTTASTAHIAASCSTTEAESVNPVDSWS
jgi:hypothetical protein